MEFLGIIWDTVKGCSNCTANASSYIRHLEANVDALSQAKRELDSSCKDVSGRIEQAIEADFVPREQRGEKEKAKLCLGGFCSQNCWSGYNVGKEVVDMTEAVKDQTSKGHFDVVADPRPPPVVEILPKENNIVGIESRLSEVWRYIEDDGVKIIGLYGVRGAGKSTLLKQLNDMFSDMSHKFGAVIMVKASTELKHRKNSRRIDPDGDTWKNRDDQGRAAEIFRRLRNKKFALLLDDLRERIELSEAGVPVQNASKIVFTTIFEEVCSSMSVDWRFKVDYLPQKEAWNLFRLKVTDEVLNSHPEIRELAETVANMCGGLPLALVTIGRAMASRRDPDNWRYAIEELQRYPSGFESMGTRVFPLLKFSYDRLTSETYKTCFLYGSLFPRNQIIMKDELIELWIGEGLLRDSHNIAAARREGKFILESLKLACLLEEVEVNNSEDFVKMHDMLRDMALWIASSQEANKILVFQETEESIKLQETASWNEAVRISLWRSPSIDSLSPTPPCCPRLLTLLVRYTMIKEFENKFFKSMHALRVLDSSQNAKLSKLHVGEGELIDLQYLNLSNTNICELPIGIKSCTQLRTLLLDGTENLKAIPVGMLSSLLSLRVFSWVPTRYDGFDYGSSVPGVTVLLLEELESLKHLQEISVIILTLDSLNKLKSSSKLQSCVRRLGHFSQNLQDLSIINCSMKDLTCILYIPRLRFLFAKDCPSLEEIIANDLHSEPSEENLSMFLHLRQAYFFKLPNLKSICHEALAFPCLERIYVLGCPNLRKLPLSLESGKRNGVLIGEEEWWNQLEWDDEATKHVFSSKLIITTPQTGISIPQPSYTYEATIRPRVNY
ncbi:hypothetical protein CUMW_136240 [Citrus unshiu]|nr:hypothetical protein CUMW_136240 [Citrus unshiu]